MPAGNDVSSWPQDAVEVGRVVGAWGLKGWVKVQSFATDPQALFATRRWFLKASQDLHSPLLDAAAASLPGQLTITQAKEHGDVIVALAQEVPDRNAAEALRGARVFVGRSIFPATAADEFYWVDLIGLDVVNRQGELLGAVAGLLDTGAQSVLRVTSSAGTDAEVAAERLIPFVAAYVDDVNLERRVITVDWGLDF
ncbi:MAG: ribosome maturation factor RimM [Burkholderiaceae bacterium]